MQPNRRILRFAHAKPCILRCFGRPKTMFFLKGLLKNHRVLRGSALRRGPKISFLSLLAALGRPGGLLGPKKLQNEALGRPSRTYRAFAPKMFKNTRFGRQSCFKNAAKPKDFTISACKTVYFTRVWALQDHVFLKGVLKNHRVLRGSALRRGEKSAF